MAVSLPCALAAHPEGSEHLAEVRAGTALLAGPTLCPWEGLSACPETLCAEVRHREKGAPYEPILFIICPFSQQQSEPMSMALCLLMQSLLLDELKIMSFLHQSAKLV